MNASVIYVTPTLWSCTYEISNVINKQMVLARFKPELHTRRVGFIFINKTEQLLTSYLPVSHFDLQLM